MSKDWYPIINHETCTGCGACIKKCSHGVYKQGSSRPVVAYPEGCIQGCRGCGNLCPSGAIEYLGEICIGDSNNGCCCS